jgi:hypothetical protein
VTTKVPVPLGGKEDNTLSMADYFVVAEMHPQILKYL